MASRKPGAVQTFYNRRSVFELLKRELRDGRNLDPTDLLDALARSQWTLREFDDVSSLVKERTDDASRRLFVRTLAKYQGNVPEAVLADRDIAAALDFGGRVTDDMIRAVAWEGRPNDWEYQSSANEIERRQDFIRRRLKAFSAIGFDLEIEERKDRKEKQTRTEPKRFQVPEGRRVLEAKSPLRS